MIKYRIWDSVTKGVIFYVLYSLSLMKTDGEITFGYFEPQISFSPGEETFIILVNDKKCI